MSDGKKRTIASEIVPEKNKEEKEGEGTVVENITGEKKEIDAKKQENESKTYDYSPYDEDIRITIELEKWNREWVKERRREGNYPW